jgi:hypothetical protein
MMGRYIIFAGLFATAAFANAGTVDALAVTVQPAWTFNAGTDAEPKAFQSSLAGPGGSWSAHSRRGDIGSSSTMLFSQHGSPFSAAPVVGASTSASQPHAAAAAPAATPAAFTESAKAPADAAAIVAPAPAEMAAIVVSADVIAGAEAPAALAAIPEPATGMLMLAGLLGAGFMTRRRK